MWWSVRLLDIPTGPLHMGYEDGKAIHRLHHRAHDPRQKGENNIDPDWYMTETHLVISFFSCLFESEVSVILQLVRSNYSGANLSLTWAVYKTLMLVIVASATDRLYVWLAAARLGNWFAMFVFHNGLHEDECFRYGLCRRLSRVLVGGTHSDVLERLLNNLVCFLLGQDISKAVAYHEVHHTRPDIPVQYLATSGLVSA